MVMWIIVALAVVAVGVVLWRLDRRMDRHGITADPVAGRPTSASNELTKDERHGRGIALGD